MIVILGGTGRLGSALLSRLPDLPLRVAARRAPPAGSLPAGVEFVTADVRDAWSVARALDGADLVVSAVQGLTGTDGATPASVDRDGNIAVVEAAERTGATAVLVSVVGAAADAPLEMMRMKHAAEDRLRAGTAPWTIVRAAAFWETWVELLTATRGAPGWPDIFGVGPDPIPFVPISKVVDAVERAVRDESVRGSVLEVVGDEPLTLRELAGLPT